MPEDGVRPLWTRMSAGNERVVSNAWKPGGFLGPLSARYQHSPLSTVTHGDGHSALGDDEAVDWRSGPAMFHCGVCPSGNAWMPSGNFEIISSIWLNVR